MPEPIGDLLARALEEIECGRATAEVLSEAGESADELAWLLAIAERLRSAEPPRPSAAFRRTARARLLARITAGPPGAGGDPGRADGNTNGRPGGPLNGSGRVDGTAHADGHGHPNGPAPGSLNGHGHGPLNGRPNGYANG